MKCKIRLLNPTDIKNIKIVTKEEIVDEIKISQTDISFFGLVSEKGKILKLRDCLYGREKILLLDKSSYMCEAFVNSDFFVVLQPHTFIVEESEFIANIAEKEVQNKLSYKLRSSLAYTYLEYNSQKKYIHNLDKLIEEEKSKFLKPCLELNLHIKQLKLNRKKAHRECLLLKWKYKSLTTLYSLLCSKYKDIWSYNT